MHCKVHLVSSLSTEACLEGVKWVKEKKNSTVCPGISDPPEKMFNIFASENEVYNIY